MLKHAKTLTQRAMLGLLMTAGIASLFAAPPSGRSLASFIGPATSSASFGGVYYGGFGGYGGFYFPMYGTSATPYTRSDFDSHWWTGPNSSTDPRQAGYNPSGGYPWGSVATLLLATYPKKARVILDGVFVGTMDELGPFQLPMGKHTLRVESPGFEPSETVLKVEEPAVQQLDVHLSAIRHGPKPAPRD